MTTPQAAAAYLAEHQRQWNGRPLAIYNPHERPEAELPVIYGFNNGGSRDWWHADLIAEDGTHLGGHLCSNEGYMPYDLGCIEGARSDRHEMFRSKYPDGYRMEFVGHEAVRGHAGLKLAFERNQAMRPESDAEAPK